MNAFVGQEVLTEEVNSQTSLKGEGVSYSRPWEECSGQRKQHMSSGWPLTSGCLSSGIPISVSLFLSIVFMILGAMGQV